MRISKHRAAPTPPVQPPLDLNMDHRSDPVYTYTMERTQIYLSEAELQVLDRLARATGHTRSQLIREAIGRAYMKRTDQDVLLERLEASRGSWVRRESGKQQVERLRRGRLARLHT